MEDLGYHPYGNSWWTFEDCPKAYTYADINTDYGEEYFNSNDHPGVTQAVDLYNYMQEVYRNNFGKEFKTVLELGGGSGELSRQFDLNKVWARTIEGTQAGKKKLLEKGIPYHGIDGRDIRKINYYFAYKDYDLVVCTEIAEHIEPWFASKLVEVCTNSSDVVWFSAADQNRPAHYHHPNEAPIWAWDNIFEFFGYRYLELDGRHDRADRLYIND